MARLRLIGTTRGDSKDMAEGGGVGSLWPESTEAREGSLTELGVVGETRGGGSSSSGRVICLMRLRLL